MRHEFDSVSQPHVKLTEFCSTVPLQSCEQVRIRQGSVVGTTEGEVVGILVGTEVVGAIVGDIVGDAVDGDEVG